MLRYRRKGEADKFNVNNALVCEFHFNQSNANNFIGRGKILKRSSVPSFHDVKEVQRA